MTVRGEGEGGGVTMRGRGRGKGEINKVYIMYWSQTNACCVIKCTFGIRIIAEREALNGGSILMMCVRTYVSVTLRNVEVTSRWNVAVSRLRA